MSNPDDILSLWYARILQCDLIQYIEQLSQMFPQDPPIILFHGSAGDTRSNAWASGTLGFSRPHEMHAGRELPEDIPPRHLQAPSLNEISGHHDDHWLAPR
jgi:hypothetical protein